MWFFHVYVVMICLAAEHFPSVGAETDSSAVVDSVTTVVSTHTTGTAPDTGILDETNQETFYRRSSEFTADGAVGVAQLSHTTDKNSPNSKTSYNALSLTTLGGTTSADQPTQHPSGPSPVPTSNSPFPEPSTKPTSPTSQPTSQPSVDETYHPVVNEQYIYQNLTYACHPIHQHSTPNVYQRIFFGLTMTSTADAERVLVWVEPYTKGQDQLSVLRNDFEKVISGNFSVNTGVLVFTRKGDRELTNQDWNSVLNYPTYRLYINFLSPRSCNRYTDGLYTPTINLQVIDRYGRKSNIVSKKLVVVTSILLYSNDMPVVVDNSVAVSTMSMKQSVFDPIHDLANITGTR